MDWSRAATPWVLTKATLITGLDTGSGLAKTGGGRFELAGVAVRGNKRAFSTFLLVAVVLART